jgi:hypothetical protein
MKIETSLALLCVTLVLGTVESRAAGLLQLRSLESQPKTESPAPAVPSVRASERVVSDQTTTVDVDLNSKTVKCSVQDYSMPMLKVLVPALADLTVLNHRNTKEGAPCIAAGRCTPTLNPAGLLKTGEGVESIPVRVVLKKNVEVDGAVCHVSLVETVSTTIRGVPFFHERVQEVAERTAEDCR